MNDSIIPHEKQVIGFSIRPFIWFPLPHRNVGKEFEKIQNNYRCIMYDPFGIPYTTLQRRVLEIVTTKAKKERDANNRISFDNMKATLEKYDMHANGTYMRPLKKAIEQIASLSVIIEQYKMENGKPISKKAVNFQIAKNYEIEWANGRMNEVSDKNSLFNTNIMTLREEFCKQVDLAIPHNQHHYMSISSPYELDLYQWLTTKMYTLNARNESKDLVRWTHLYDQFLDIRTNEIQEKNFRRKTKELLSDIVSHYYITAKIEFTNEGILLYKSPLLIEPDDKNAGYSLIT